MVTDAQTLELFRIADAVQSVTVEVRCDAPWTDGEERYYPAEIVLQSGFVNGRVRLVVSPADLDEWERCLDALEAEEGAVWPAGDRSAWMDIVPDDPFEVTVHDAPSTQIAVLVPVDVAEDWLEENRILLERVREPSPSSSDSSSRPQAFSLRIKARVHEPAQRRTRTLRRPCRTR